MGSSTGLGDSSSCGGLELDASYFRYGNPYWDNTNSGEKKRKRKYVDEYARLAQAKRTFRQRWLRESNGI